MPTVHGSAGDSELRLTCVNEEPPQDLESMPRAEDGDARTGNGLSPLRTRLSAQEHCELQVLACMQLSAETYGFVANDLGVRNEDFGSARARRIYRVLDRYYADHGAVPSLPQLLAYGDGIDPVDVELLASAGVTLDRDRIKVRVSDLRRVNADQTKKLKLAEAQSALARGQADVARGIIDEIKGGVVPSVRVHNTSEIFATLPESTWKIRGLHIGPGRPTMIAAYGASAKTLCAQSLAVCLSAGFHVWGFFDSVAPGRVLHLDYEQGFYATAKRYQRLAIGHGVAVDQLGERLGLACFPRLFLDSAGAADEYCRICEGQDLVVLDSLKAASPSRDENDSQVRTCLDVLTRVSEKTGSAFVVLHHAGKPQDGHSDARTIARGSSAIFDACGCVLTLTAGKTANDPRRVRQTKQPAEAVGGSIEDFELVVEDVAVGEDNAGGVRVMRVAAPAPKSTEESSDEAWAQDCERMTSIIRRCPGENGKVLIARAEMRRDRGYAVLTHLADSGKVVCIVGLHNAHTYQIGDA